MIYFRDFIGKDFKDIDPTYSSGSAHPVNKDGKVAFSLHTSSTEDAEPECITVSEITKRHIARVKESAADFLGKPVAGAVVAVPTDFTTEQRKELTTVCEQAGLKVLQIVQEPVASLFAYDATFGTSSKDKMVVVVDFGATRSDAAIIASRAGMYTVLATHHNYELGGLQLDKAIGDYFAAEFEKKYKIDPRTESARSLAKLLTEAETTKRTLSSSTSATISIESLAGGYDFHSNINRLRFELIGRKVFDQCAAFVEELLKKIDMDPAEIDELVLVGGASHTPKIASRLAAIFPDTTVIQSPSTNPKAINPSEAVAIGAAFQGSLIAGFEPEAIKESLQPVISVAPHLTKSIGIVVEDGNFIPILEAATAVPIRKSQIFTAPDAENVFIELWEGDHEIVVKTLEKSKDEKEDNDSDESDYDSEDEEIREKVMKPTKKIAELALNGIKPKSKVEIVLNIAADLKLTVAVREVGANTAVRGEVIGNESVI